MRSFYITVPIIVEGRAAISRLHLHWPGKVLGRETALESLLFSIPAMNLPVLTSLISTSTLVLLSLSFSEREFFSADTSIVLSLSIFQFLLSLSSKHINFALEIV
jgi:hypothetical protein